MPEDPVAVKTIVTTPMAVKVAERCGVELRDVLTGFKFIGEQIGLLEQAGEAERYIFGFEESYGYLSGSFVRDKDAVNASLLICEMFVWYKAQGKTLLEVLEELYRACGFYESRLLPFSFEGAEGLSQMAGADPEATGTAAQGGGRIRRGKNRGLPERSYRAAAFQCAPLFPDRGAGGGGPALRHRAQAEGLPDGVGSGQKREPDLPLWRIPAYLGLGSNFIPEPFSG